MSDTVTSLIGTSLPNGTMMDLLDPQDGTSGDVSLDVPDGTISDAELIAWLQQKSTLQNDQLRDRMLVSTVRSKFIQKLTDLKGIIDANGHPPQIKAQMEALLTEYKDTPYYGDLSAMLSPAIDTLSKVPDTVTTIGDDSLKNLQSNVASQLDGEAQKLTKIDSLALVQIQQTMADANQTSQLASNVLASRNQTSTSILGNIRA